MGPVSGAGCNVSGDSVDVVFENAHAGANAAARAIAVYTTGGDEYNVQAMNGMTDRGKKGVNEDLFEIDKSGPKVGGGTTPGSQTITVTRDMADSKGEVYLFVYHASATTYEFDYTDENGGLNTGIPFSRLSGTTTGDGADATFNNTTVAALNYLEGQVISTVEAARDSSR